MPYAAIKMDLGGTLDSAPVVDLALFRPRGILYSLQETLMTPAKA